MRRNNDGTKKFLQKSHHHPEKAHGNLSFGSDAVWVDGSYHCDSGKAGGAAIVVPRNEKPQQVLAFNLIHDPYTAQNSNETELLSAICALEALPPGSIRKIFTDSASVHDLVKIAQREVETKGEKATLAHCRQMSLFPRLEEVLGHHPDIGIRRISRRKAYIPMADAFARVARKMNGSISPLTRLLKKWPDMQSFTLLENTGQIVTFGRPAAIAVAPPPAARVQPGWGRTPATA